MIEMSLPAPRPSATHWLSAEWQIFKLHWPFGYVIAYLAPIPKECLPLTGKTAKQGLDSGGRPLHMLNAFVHDLQAVVGQWSTGVEKTNEPTLLRRHLQELLDTYPMLPLSWFSVKWNIGRESLASKG